MVNPISILTQLNLAAVDLAEIAAYDTKDDFLHSTMHRGSRTFIQISGYCSV